MIIYFKIYLRYDCHRYTKPLVQSASLSDQKYNPEMESGIPQDKVSEMAALGEKLRQARQVHLYHYSDYIVCLLL